MSWTRTDDLWTRKRLAEGLNFEEIGYLFALIQECSSTDRFDGRIKRFTARTMGECSDVDAILGHLIEVGQAEWDGDHLVMLHAMDHLPSEEVRDRTEAERLKKRRQRAHAKGNHELCSPTNCQSFHVPGTVPGTDEGQGSGEQQRPADVPGTVGTGQVGHGREELRGDQLSGTVPVQRTQSPPPGGVDLTTGELSEPGPYKPCTECGSTSGTCRCFDEPEVGTCGWCGPDSVCDCPGGPGPRPPALARQ